MQFESLQDFPDYKWLCENFVETMYASSGNKHFFTKSCHRQTYQNYEQPPRTSQNLYFQSHFSVLKIGRIFPKKIFYEEYLTRRPTFIKKCF